jgi:hypothetical protein
MEYFDKSKICREFLKQYSESLYPELLPKLMKVAIYSLYKAYSKWNISMQEIDEFIHFFNYKNRNFELEQNTRKLNNNYREEESKYNYDCPPCDEFYIPKNKKIKKLNMGFIPPENAQYPETEQNTKIKNCYGLGKFYPNDDVYINDSNNFYDENYYIPRTRSYRNIQLYHKRLSNPKFITQEKRIYPHWWWNYKDDIEQDDYSDDDSEMDHRPSKPGRFPKKLEDKLKKKMKRQMRNKSFNGMRSVKIPFYDEERIFSNIDKNNDNTTNNENGNDNYSNDNNNEKYPYQNRDYSPSGENTLRRPYGGTAMDGFGRPYLNPENNNNKMNNSMNVNLSPLDMNNSNLNYRMPPNTLGLNNRRNNYDMGNNNDNNDYKSQNNQTGENNSTGGPNATGSNFSSSTLKNQILNKRMMKESTFLSYDKDFNVNGLRKKVKGKTKKGVKYSVSGNQLNEDKRGIRRRKK